MNYTETMTDAELAAVEVERCPVASSSRPMNYVPAASDKPELPTQIWTPVSSGDMQIWQPGAAVDERTSAVDRSVGLLLRQAPMFVIWLILAAVAGLIAWLSLIHISEPTRPY